MALEDKPTTSEKSKHEHSRNSIRDKSRPYRNDDRSYVCSSKYVHSSSCSRRTHPKILARKLAASRDITRLEKHYDAIRKEDEEKQFEREKQVRLLEQENKEREELQQIQQEVMQQEDKMRQKKEKRRQEQEKMR